MRRRMEHRLQRVLVRPIPPTCLRSICGRHFAHSLAAAVGVTGRSEVEVAHAAAAAAPAAAQAGAPVVRVGTTSRAAGRAGALARAYASGDRAVLERAGLNYDELRGLDDRVAVGIRIVEAAFDSRADSTIEDDESREIVAKVVEWILESPVDQTPTPDEIVRHSIELIIADVTLTEVGDLIRAESSRERRAEAEQEIRDAATVYASQVTLNATGPTEQEIAAAIEGGIHELGRIFGAGV